MRLRRFDIALDWEWAPFSRELGHQFRLQSEHVAHWFRLCLAKEKAECDAINHLIVVGAADAHSMEPLLRSHALNAYVPFDQNGYGAAAGGALSEFFVEKVEAALLRTEARGVSLPYCMLRKAMAEFRDSDYRCEWTVARRHLPGRRGRWLCLRGRLAPDRFAMAIDYREGNETRLSHQLFETDAASHTHAYLCRNAKILIEGGRAMIVLGSSVGEVKRRPGIPQEFLDAVGLG